MKVRVVFVTAIAASLVFVSSKILFSQDAAPGQNVEPQDTQAEVIQGGAVPETKAAEPETQWVWGEVVTVDPVNKAISVKYLDYETDQEKEISIGTDDKTTFENAVSIDELKPKDTVSIDYISSDGKNIAKNISVEKPETQQPPQTQTEPENVAPATTAEQQAQPE